MPRASDLIAVIVVALLALGLVMVASAGMEIAPSDDAERAAEQSAEPAAAGAAAGAERESVSFRSILMSSTGLYAVLAVLAFVAGRWMPVRALASPRWSRLIPLLVPVCLVAMVLTFVPGVGHESKGAARWVRMPGLGFTWQPSELVKWCAPLVLAWFAATRPRGMRRFAAGVLPALGVLGVFSALIAKEDLGTAVLVFAAGSVVLMAGGARMWHFGVIVAPVMLLGAVAATMAEPYRMRRITAFLDPYGDPADSGYHMIQSLIAVAGGGPSGRGLGYGVQKFGYLPEDRTDFLFAIVCEELGLVGAVSVVALYGVLIVACLWVAVREASPMLKLAALGVTATLGMQALINLFVVTAMAPTKGIALPLMSSGGTGWVLCAGSLGLIAAIDRSRRDSADGAFAVVGVERRDADGALVGGGRVGVA